ncbi:serine--tRNA ligase [Patescibacteria group bacterium]|nr:serine--tRNA ligase [Patescibacteria group bacterium]
MMDIKWILEDPEKIKASAKAKNADIDIDKLIRMIEKRNEILQKIENFRARQNEVSKLIPQAKNKEELLTEMSKVKEDLKAIEPDIEAIEKDIEAIAMYVPNPILDSVPIAKDEDGNEVIRKWGEPRKFDFEPKDHIELGKTLDIIDIERGTRMSGARFYYLKNEGAMLEWALLQFVMQKLIAKGFSPIVPPVLVKEEAMIATGFFPADKNEIYHVNPDDDDLYLVGTSEVPLTMLHYQEILEEKDLPIRYCAFSPCFRREAGSYGKDTAGVIRVHQFDKIEMFIFSHPDKSEEEHETIREIEEEIMQELGLPYQLMNIASGDLGNPAAKKYDIETWIPTQEKYRELTSCSNCTAYQARRAQIRYRTTEGKKEYVHTLNGTACSMTRPIVAIIENYQEADGSVTIPEVLRPFMGGRDTIKAQ